MATYKRVETIEAWQQTDYEQIDAYIFSLDVGLDCTLSEYNSLSGTVLHKNEYLVKQDGRYYRLSEEKFKGLGYQIVLT